MAGEEIVRRRDLRVVAFAIGLSAAGDFVALIALALRANDMSADGIGVAAIFICLWAPVAVLAGHVGLLVDRFETTRLLIVVSVLQALVAVALAFTSALPVLLAVTALLGCGVAVSQAAEFALVPLVTGDRTLQEANGLVETARYMGFTVGPLLGGLLTAVGGTRTALLLDALSFVAVAAAVLTLGVRRRPVAVPEGEVRRARDGITFLFHDRVLALVLAVAFVSLLFMSASIPADLVFVQNVLGVEDVGFGLVISMWTLGMVLGAGRIARRISSSALAVAACAAVAVQGLAKALPPLWLVFAFMVVCYFVGGIAHGIKNVAFRTLIHERVPEELHGRAFAAYNGLRNTAELVALAVGGVLVAVLGARGTLFLAGCGCAVVGVAGIALLGRRSQDAVGEQAAGRAGRR